MVDVTKKEPSGRLARWALKLQEYQIQIGHRPEKNQNQNSNFLSRIPVSSVLSVEMKLEGWETDQLQDPSCKTIVEDLRKEVE